MRKAAHHQLELFWLALGFFSRLPIPSHTPYSEERMNQAGRYFGLVGVILGLAVAGSFFLFAMLFPTSVAVVLTMVFSLLLTGAFHEDGLTDMADGIGGGMTLERRLTIMKDSRIGTYGAATLIMALLSKYVLLTELAMVTDMLIVLVVTYTLSRVVAATLIYDMPYVSDLDSSKSKPLANRQSKADLTVLIATGVLASLLLPVGVASLLLVSAVLFRWLFKTWLMKRIGGFTGDCLGAAQQLFELLSYLIILAWVTTAL
ncbi:adenosylcobinamide-GDP ribazoletransferase [Vibrio sp. 404]|uniref:Adenosylcobinamide-GDP ribazoletransferase n=1 Tax=Vibrio marinisediminis TaxID=2758441 RepID=A0A7W2ITW4_9VIBR|nr:adenosylcobinamide-GDP ribazoletransferase [Vibrio marinisediminis]MBA5762981.1 adenosylcobinamide-GDP ribazoletransferase [Vibrio marinisediminis]